MAADNYPTLGAPRWPATLSRLGLWGIGFGVLAAATSGPLHRLGLAGPGVALSVLGIGLLVTVIALMLAIIGFLAARSKGVAIAQGALALSIVVGLGLVGYLLSWMRTGMGVPPIHEISTDLETPPSFVAIRPLRDKPGINPVDYVREQPGRAGQTINVPDAQRKAYPEIQPAMLAIPMDQAFARVENAVRSMGLEIVAAVPAEGRLEATATTFFFGFKDDVVVRVRAEGSGARVDVRSKSRVGVGDAGTNAKRVRALLAKLRSE